MSATQTIIKLSTTETMYLLRELTLRGPISAHCLQKVAASTLNEAGLASLENDLLSPIDQAQMCDLLHEIFDAWLPGLFCTPSEQSR